MKMHGLLEGSEAEACGNGTRCVVSYLSAKLGKRGICLETAAGLLRGSALGPQEVQVEQGKPVMLKEGALEVAGLGIVFVSRKWQLSDIVVLTSKTWESPRN